jgi:hypothetical protein
MTTTRNLIPDFFVIGNAKCGTSWLNNALGNHPQLLISRDKECNVLSEGLQEWRAAYERQYVHYSGQQALGDGSLSYLRPHILKHIRRNIPDARHIFLMRDPIERIKSARLQRLKAGTERVDLDVAISGFLKGRTEYSVLEHGMYHHRLQQLLEFFPRDQVLVLVMERMMENKRRTLERVFGFLGVDSEIRTELPDRVNPARIPRSYWLARALRYGTESRKGRRIMSFPLTRTLRIKAVVNRIKNANLKLPPPDAKKLTKEQIESLVRIYLPEVERLEAMLGDCFSEWATINAYRKGQLS